MEVLHLLVDVRVSGRGAGRGGAGAQLRLVPRVALHHEVVLSGGIDKLCVLSNAGPHLCPVEHVLGDLQLALDAAAAAEHAGQELEWLLLGKLVKAL